MLALRTEIQAGLDAAQRDKALLDRLVDIRLAEADDEDGSATEAAYANAFREAGIDLASLPPAEAGAKIKARQASVVVGLAGALDDWASIRRGKRGNPGGAAQLSEAACVADPDLWRKTCAPPWINPTRRPFKHWQRRRSCTSWARSACNCWAQV